jgi:hypothetical protein
MQLLPAALRQCCGRRMGVGLPDPGRSWNRTRRIGPQLLDGLRAAGATGDLRTIPVEKRSCSTAGT